MKVYNKKYLQKPDKFQMLHQPQLKQQGHLVSIDLQDADLHIPIHIAYMKYLSFLYIKGKTSNWLSCPLEFLQPHVC